MLWLHHNYPWFVSYPTYFFISYGVMSFCINVWDLPGIKRITGRAKPPIGEFEYILESGFRIRERVKETVGDKQAEENWISHYYAWTGEVYRLMKHYSVSKAVLWNTPNFDIEEVGLSEFMDLRLEELRKFIEEYGTKLT